MENPNTWNDATRIIDAALSRAHDQAAAGVIGHSTARIVHDALVHAGYLKEPNDTDHRPNQQF